MTAIEKVMMIYLHIISQGSLVSPNKLYYTSFLIYLLMDSRKKNYPSCNVLMRSTQDNQ